MRRRHAPAADELLTQDGHGAVAGQAGDLLGGRSVVSRSPSAGWVEDQVRTAARVATLIGRRFHISYSVSGATRLMHRLGFSPQCPPDG
ncbi:hypothetical protein GCM10010271_69880 [Streptomyces kurssanovii]|nr:hypothetical protein GCM10010271_69880 [Streptomyces kurssanovii]